MKFLESRTFNVAVDNVDTDQIIPAQFLTTTTRAGLGKVAFYNWRYDQNGTELAEHLFKNFNAEETKIIVGGNNFGCGSSREHAPWALLDMGFKAVISTQIADIFRNNSLKNGLLPIVVKPEVHKYLLENPGIFVSIDIDSCTCEIESFGAVQFELDAFSQYCLSKNYDQLDYLRSKIESIRSYEARRPGFARK